MSLKARWIAWRDDPCNFIRGGHCYHSGEMVHVKTTCATSGTATGGAMVIKTTCCKCHHVYYDRNIGWA